KDGRPGPRIKTLLPRGSASRKAGGGVTRVRSSTVATRGFRGLPPRARGEASASNANRRELGSNDLSHLPRTGVTADVARSNVRVCQDLEDGLFDGVSRFFLAQMFQHHRARPDLGHRISDSFPGDVGSRAMYRLK